jgi:transposase-like protein
MTNTNDNPKTLLDAVKFFSDYENCHKFMVAGRWPDGVVRCPTCNSDHVTYLASAQVWKCYAKHGRAKFSLKAGTIFEDSPIPLSKWLPTVWLLASCKNGISSYEVARTLGVTQKTAWFMLHRIRKAMQSGPFVKLKGEVEVDETFIGGKARNMHVAQRHRRITGAGATDKTAVMGILERGGEVRTTVIEDRKKKTLQAEVKKHVEAGSALYSDELKSYDGLAGEYAHQVINHAVAYVDGKVHTNGA